MVGAVLIPGAKAPRLITRQDLKLMKPGSVIIDVAIDQGGCVETSRPTTHSDPTYLEEGVLHYCVTNMPGAVGRTSTFALCNVTLPWVLQLARPGVEAALRQSPPLASAANIVAGRVTNQAVAETFGLKYERASGRPYDNLGGQGPLHEMMPAKIETLRWVGDERGHLVLIDQTRLPVELVELECRDCGGGLGGDQAAARPRRAGDRHCGGVRRGAWAVASGQRSGAAVFSGSEASRRAIWPQAGRRRSICFGRWTG